MCSLLLSEWTTGCVVCFCLCGLWGEYAASVCVDYRLNPLLQKGCQQDIPKFCADIMVNEGNDELLEGKVINCLKKQFAIKVSPQSQCLQQGLLHTKCL